MNGDLRTITHQWLSTVYLWLPVTSKKSLELNLKDIPFEIQANLAPLLLCMTLATQSVVDNPQAALSSFYYTTESYCSLLESSAVLSLRLLQSLVIIATYLTTGQCARLGHALGVHDRRHAPQVLRRNGAWTEYEETHRAWWAVLVLDRYAHC